MCESGAEREEDDVASPSLGVSGDRAEPGSTSVAGAVTTVLLVVSAAATTVLTLRAASPVPETIVLVLLSVGGLGIVVATPRLRQAVSLGLVVGLGTVLLVVAVTVPPPPGSDLWVYALYGRTMVEHDQSPYVHPPSDFPEDPWLDDIGLFRDSRTFYGPLFTGFNAAVAAVGQDSRLAVRLGYQIGAALAVAASLVLLSRAGANPPALAMVALNPVIIVDVVGQGRMDAYLGLGLLGATLLAMRRRPHLAALAVAAATLVKAPAGVALVGLLVWVWHDEGWRRAATVAATGGTVMAAAYLVAGGPTALAPLLEVRDQTNTATIWVLLRDHGWAVATGDDPASLGPIGPLPVYASVAGALLATLLVVARRTDRLPHLLLALPVLAYLLTSMYPTARYAAWILPLLALTTRTRATVVTVAVSWAIFAMVQQRAALIHQRGEGMVLGPVVRPDGPGLLRVVPAAPVVLALVGIVVLAVEAGWRLRWPRRPRTSRRPAPQGQARRQRAAIGVSKSDSPGLRVDRPGLRL